MASDDKDRESSATEPRVGDILSGRVSRETLDPETVANLAAWFGAPSQSFVDAERRASGDAERRASGGLAGKPRYTTPDAVDDDPELREMWKRRQQAMDAVDPAFLAHFEAKASEAHRYTYLPEPLSLPIEKPLHKFDLDAWRLNFITIREWEIDEDLYDVMRQQTPQAVLRDLHRPDETWPLVLVPLDLGVDIAGQQASKSIASVMQARYDGAMNEWEIASSQGRRELSLLRAQLAEPWEHSCVPESERIQTRSELPTAEDLKWFGSVGYDPYL